MVSYDLSLKEAINLVQSGNRTLEDLKANLSEFPVKQKDEYIIDLIQDDMEILDQDNEGDMEDFEDGAELNGFE